MTRANRLCDVCASEMSEDEIARGRVCIDCVLAGMDPERAVCPACSRMITEEGMCGCVEGVAPEASRKVSMVEGLAWGFFGIAVLLWVLL